MSHVTRTPFSRSKGQGRQAALLSAALTRKAAAAVSVGTYSAWESTATLRLVDGARGARASTGEKRGGAYCVATRTVKLTAVSLICSCQLYMTVGIIKVVAAECQML